MAISTYQLVHTRTINILTHSKARTLFLRAAVCSTAVRKPVGKVKPESQKSTGG